MANPEMHVDRDTLSSGDLGVNPFDHILGFTLSHLSTSYQKLAKKYYKAASSMFEAGDYRWAAYLFTQAIRFDKSYADAYFKRGLCMCMLESYGEAKGDAYRLLGVQRRTADAFYLLGYIAEKEGKTTLAVELYRELLRVEPEYLPAVMRLDKIKTGQKEEKKYRTLVEEAFEYAESLCRDVFGEGGYIKQAKWGRWGQIQASPKRHGYEHGHDPVSGQANPIQKLQRHSGSGYP